MANMIDREMYDVQIEFVDGSMVPPIIHEKSIIDPEFKEGFLVYMTPDRRAKFIRTDWILAVTISEVKESA